MSATEAMGEIMRLPQHAGHEALIGRQGSIVKENERKGGGDRGEEIGVLNGRQPAVAARTSPRQEVDLADPLATEVANRKPPRRREVQRGENRCIEMHSGATPLSQSGAVASARLVSRPIADLVVLQPSQGTDDRLLKF